MTWRHSLSAATTVRRDSAAVVLSPVTGRPHRPPKPDNVAVDRDRGARKDRGLCFALTETGSGSDCSAEESSKNEPVKMRTARISTARRSSTLQPGALPLLKVLSSAIGACHKTLYFIRPRQGECQTMKKVDRSNPSQTIWFAAV